MLSILCVDDDPSLLEICKIFLEADSSMNVEIALSAKEALSMIRHREYDAIISDYEMPSMNGIALLKKLRSMGDTIPFLIFTGKGREEIVIEAFNGGADFYIQKGGDPKSQFAELIHKVKKAVERKRTDLALEHSNSVLRATLEATADGILVIDRDGVITTFNQKFLHMWNIPEDIAEGQKSARLLEYLLSRSEDPLEFQRIIDTINTSPDGDSYDTFTLDEGQVFRLYTQPQMTGNSVMGRVWSFRDITLRNRAETELRAAYEQIRAGEEQLKQQYTDLTATTALIRESEERLRSFTEVIPDGIGICVDGKLVEANEQLASLFGLTVPELLGRDILDCIASEWREQIREQVSSGSPDPSELQVTRTEGVVIPVELRGRSISYRGLAAWASVWRDLSERRMAERTLAESEAKYRSVFMAENNPLLLIEQKTMTIRDVNDAACQTYGYFRNEFVGRNVLDLCTTPENVLHDAQRMRPGIQRYHHLRKDGKVFPVEVSTAFFILDNRPVFIYSVLDLTHAKLIEDALKLANIKLNLLLGITRHDILNKVSALMGYNELLSQRISDPPLKKMLESQEKATMAIRTQIEFTKEYEELGGKALRWQMVNEIITRTYDQFLKTVPLIIDLGDIEIYADPMIEKVFYNLFDNAFRYGEGISNIKISSRVVHDELTIVFEDDGKGIPVEEKEMIFCQGFGKNTGLGLYLSREILSITSMSIRESGEYLKGAKFEIRVPAGFFRIRGDDENTRVSGDSHGEPLSPV